MKVEKSPIPQGNPTPSELAREEASSASPWASTTTPATVFPNEYAPVPDSFHACIRPAQGVAKFTAGLSRAVVGRQQISNLAELLELAKTGSKATSRGGKEVKFLLLGVDTPNPELHLINMNEFSYHFDYYDKVIGKGRVGGDTFNNTTYFTDRRKNVAGTLVWREGETSSPADDSLTVEFWPTDPVKASFIKKVFDAFASAAPSLVDRLKYHPAGASQESLLRDEAADFERFKIPTVRTDELYRSQPFLAMNPGKGFGTLRVIDPNEQGIRPPSARDIVIFKSVPNDLGHVSGVITEAPQTQLSHVNLKAIQNKTPNAYIKGAATDPKLTALVGKVVCFEVTDEGYSIREASKQEADDFLESKRPSQITKLSRTLTVRTIKPLSSLKHTDVKAFGAKAANLGELKRILPDGMVPQGQAIPFWFYDRFMRETGLATEAATMLADPLFKADVSAREQMLAAFRRKIRRTEVPKALADKIGEAQQTFAPGAAIRCRSSTNNEDLEGFNGAGLYDSYTHRADEGHLAETVKQVWASLWNFRAFEEREFYRVDHTSAAMAVALHPNTDDERVNGVAVTKNIYDPEWRGFYVNAQAGESLVTNPDAATTPDELLISAIGPNGEYETQFLQKSSLVTDGQALMTSLQISALTSAMERIQNHFAAIYGRQNDKTFAMDIEFKFRADGSLWIKQARPWVD